MILFACGDSNTFGDELSDRTKAWPTRLGLMFGATVVNKAKPGRSNPYIYRTTMEWIATNRAAIQASPDDYMIVIGWTGPDRSEFKSDDWQYIGAAFASQKRAAVRSYYANLHSVEQANILTGQYMVALHVLLRAWGVRHLFFDSYEAFDWRYCDYLKGMIDPKVMVPDNMLLYCAPYPRGPGNHPLEAGHQAWAEHLAQFTARIP